MEFELIENMDSRTWDETISPFENRFVFHSSAWLRFVEETWSVKPLRFRMTERGNTQGFFVGFLVKKGFFTLLGSPLTGWYTDYLGPIVNTEFDTERFLGALEELCRQWKIHFIRIGNPILKPEIMQTFSFCTSESKIFSVALSLDEDRMWNNLTGKCRNRIRRGMKNGLIVEDSHDPVIVDEFFEQHVQVFTRQNLPPKYSIREVRNLYRNLKPVNQLFSLRVKQGDRTIATGLFPHDDRFMHSFSIASRTTDLHLCPNELLYWTAMRLGAKRGIKAFSIGGPYSSDGKRNKFKEKFNGDEITFYRFGKSCSAFGWIGLKIFQTFNPLRNWRRSPGA